MSKVVLVFDMPSNCSNCCQSYDCYGEFYVCAAMDKALEEHKMDLEKPDWCPLKQASEKGEPKKPVLIYGRMRCPTCKGNTRSLNLYCDCCGQRIDWSDSEMECICFEEGTRC